MTAGEVRVHVVHAHSRSFLTRRAYASWREIQAGCADYLTSLGPWSPAGRVEYLRAEYPDLDPDAAVQVREWLASGREEADLRFRRLAAPGGPLQHAP